jgi:hypothetical protein
MVWCFDYYEGRQIDWNFAFGFSYPPLLSDLSNGVAEPAPTAIQSHVSEDPLAVLCFVLPVEKRRDLMPESLLEKLGDRVFSKHVRTVWAYCRYFWESHLEFEGDELTTIRSLVTKYRKHGLDKRLVDEYGGSRRSKKRNAK